MPSQSGQELSLSERTFLKKYLGIDDPANTANTGVPLAQGVSVLSAQPDQTSAEASPASPAEAPKPSIDELLRAQELVTLVGYFVLGDIFAIPIDVVLEVIHFEQPHKLPKSPAFMPGVVNLRGKILPVIDLAQLLVLDAQSKPRQQGKGLIIVCEGKGLQVGLMIDRLHTMFKARQEQINWNADVHLGASAELLCGLLDADSKLHGILSIDKVVDKILEF